LSVSVEVRVKGTPDEVRKMLDFLRRKCEVEYVSGYYPCRYESGKVRVYVRVRRCADG